MVQAEKYIVVQRVTDSEMEQMELPMEMAEHGGLGSLFSMTDSGSADHTRNGTSGSNGWVYIEYGGDI